MHSLLFVRVGFTGFFLNWGHHDGIQTNNSSHPFCTPPLNPIPFLSDSHIFPAMGMVCFFVITWQGIQCDAEAGYSAK
jgi:hypothetical protein